MGTLMQPCPLCDCVKLISEGRFVSIIHEFKNSFLVLGDHQYFKGYSVLILKHHVRELHDLTQGVQQELNSELMSAGKAIFDAYKPWKMNYSCYGNAVPHIHWHLFPRYESDPDQLVHPWLHMDKFKNHLGTPEERVVVIEKIRAEFA